MGISGHIGIAFEPQDEALIKAIFTGEGEAPEGEDWVKHHTNFGLIRENWWEMHRTFEQLAAGDQRLAALATVVEGDGHLADGLRFFPPADVAAMAEACLLVSDQALKAAIERALAHPDFVPQFSAFPRARQPLAIELAELFDRIAADLIKVSAGGWALIAGMV